MLTAIALDDELPALEIIEAFCSQIDSIDLRKTFTRTSEASHYLQGYPVDLLFLDINMPAQTGIEFFRNLLGTSDTQQTMVIFTTAHSEFAVESYTLNAVDYLLKPFTFDRFFQAALKAIDYHQFLHQSTEKMQPNVVTHLFFRIDYSLVKVTVADILFIEGLDNYLKIHLENQKPIVVRLTMKGMLEKLPTNDFIRVHRSYIVPLNRVQSLRNKLITIGNEEIPLGNRYESDFYAAFPKMS